MPSETDDERRTRQIETLQRMYAEPSPPQPSLEHSGDHNAAFIDAAGNVSWQKVPDFRASYLVTRPPSIPGVIAVPTKHRAFSFSPGRYAEFKFSSVQNGIAIYRQTTGSKTL